MKRIYFFISFTILIGILLSSCSDSTTYAELLKSEKTLIKDYIKRNGINIIKTFPADSIWGPNDYVLTSSGLYFHMVSYGIDSVGADTLALYNKVVPRYKQYTLEEISDTTSNWSTIDQPNPSVFIYGNTSESCTAFQEAAYYLHRNDAECKIIVPSKIGFNSNMLSVTPYGYDLKIKIRK